MFFLIQDYHTSMEFYFSKSFLIPFSIEKGFIGLANVIKLDLNPNISVPT